MSIESFIQNYGYLALFVGSFCEGETIVVVAGFAAHRGYLHLPWVMLWAFCGTVLSDQLFYWLGYQRGRPFVIRRPALQRRARKVQLLLERHQWPVLLGFRFFYGLRNVTPFVVGASRFPPLRFVMLNLLGAALWSVAVSLGGYAFGEALQRILQDLKHYELWVAGVLLVGGAVVWAILRIRGRTAARGAIGEHSDPKGP